TLLERKQRLTQDLHTLIARLRQEYPKYAALHYPQPIPPEALPLREQEVLLEYALGEEATYLFRVRKGGVDKVWRGPGGGGGSGGQGRDRAAGARVSLAVTAGWGKRYGGVLTTSRAQSLWPPSGRGVTGGHSRGTHHHCAGWDPGITPL